MPDQSHTKDWLCSQCGEWHSDHPSQSETKASDLASKLRAVARSSTIYDGEYVSDVCDEAADEIESLRAKLTAAEANAIGAENARQDAVKELAAAESRLKIALELLDKARSGYIRESVRDDEWEKRREDFLRSLTEGDGK